MDLTILTLIDLGSSNHNKPVLFQLTRLSLQIEANAAAKRLGLIRQDADLKAKVQLAKLSHDRIASMNEITIDIQSSSRILASIWLIVLQYTDYTDNIAHAHQMPLDV